MPSVASNLLFGEANWQNFTPTGTGIQAHELPHQKSIRNGFVASFKNLFEIADLCADFRGIAVRASEGNYFLGNSINGPSRAIHIFDGATGNTFEDNLITASGGIVIGGDANENSLRNNVIKDGRGPRPVPGFFAVVTDGIVIQDPPVTGNIIEHNTITDMVGSGVRITGGVDNRFANNRITNNAQGGIVLVDAHMNDFTRNDIHLNEGLAVSSTDSAGDPLGIELSVFDPVAGVNVGNWWGGDCGKGLFIPEVYSNAPNVKDPHPFNHAVAHISSKTPPTPTECPE